jgi:hypothetical protein
MLLGIKLSSAAKSWYPKTRDGRRFTVVYNALNVVSLISSLSLVW